MNYTNYKDKTRNKYVILVDKVVNNNLLSRKIEQSIYNKTIQDAIHNDIYKSWKNPYFKKLYLSKMISIYSNLKSDSYIKNTEILSKLKNNQLKAENIGNYTSYDLYPEAWKELLDKKSKQDKLKYELKPKAMTDMFTCHKCGSRSCSYYEVQTRSADEPMTQFINCLDCGNRWKQ